VRLRDRLGISAARQRQLSRGMQVALVVVLAVGAWQRDAGVLVNAGVALALTYLPGLLERDLGIPMDAGLTLWLTAAVTLHAVGTVGVPGTELESFYRSVGWWDSMTHTLSASVVAGAGYAVVRAVDLHTERIYLPPRFTFVFVLCFVLALGVLWEVFEFVLAELSLLLGMAPVLTQYGIADTMTDLWFNFLGGVVVATWGTAHLTDVVGALASRLDRRQA
jgi:Na+/H+-dicarboxylate symporter